MNLLFLFQYQPIAIPDTLGHNQLLARFSEVKYTINM